MFKTHSSSRPSTSTPRRACKATHALMLGACLLAGSACQDGDPESDMVFDPAYQPGSENAGQPQGLNAGSNTGQPGADGEESSVFAARLAEYGKRALEAPERRAVKSPWTQANVQDPGSREVVDSAWSGFTPLYVRRLVADGYSEQIAADARGQALDQVTIDPMAIPSPALAEQTGLDIQFDLRVVKSAEHEETVTSAMLLHRGATPDPVDPSQGESARRAVPARDDLVRAAERELAAVDQPVKVDDSRILVYASLAPAVPFDTASRVDWLGDKASKLDAMREGEKLRQAEISEKLTISQGKLESLGLCKFVGGTPAAHAAYLACTPDELVKLAGSADFIREIDVIGQGAATGMRGDDLRAADGAQTGHVLAEGLDGEYGASGSGRYDVEVALLDGEGFYRISQHPAFDDWLNGPSRVRSMMTCSTTSCWTDTTNGSPRNHGAVAMAPAFSHVLQGQDSTVTTAAAREDRSFGAFEAAIEAYRWQPGGGEPALIRAANPTVDSGVDIAQISWGNSDCDNVSAYTAWRDAWDYAYSQGVFGIIAAANAVWRTNDDCSANGWASRPDMLVVGAFGDNVGSTVNGKAATPLWSWNYDTQPLMGWHWTDLSGSTNCSGTGSTCWSSAYGGAKLRFGSGTVRKARGVVDVVAPAGRQLGPEMSSFSTSTYRDQCCGTSDAAPHAAAAAVTLKDWANDNGYTAFQDPGIMHVTMLLFGDGTTGGHDPGAFPSYSTSGLSWLWGAGRLKMRAFTENGLDGPWAWGVGGFYLYDGDVVDVPIGGGPFNSDVDAWTGALSWDEPWLNSNDTSKAAADIVFQVVTTNPVGGSCVNPNGGAATTVSSDWSYDVQKRIRLRPGVVEGLHGKCAWMRFSALDVPTGPDGYNRRYVYRADYWEDLDRESYENLGDIE